MRGLRELRQGFSNLKGVDYFTNAIQVFWVEFGQRQVIEFELTRKVAYRFKTVSSR